MPPLSEVQIGANTRLGLGIEGTFAQPVRASRRAEYASSDLTTDAAPVFADSLFNSPAEFRKAVVGVIQVGGDISLNITPEGAFTRLLCGAFGAPVTTPSTTTPTGVTVTPTGTSGATTYSYRVSANNALGESLASAAVTTATGNAVLSGANFNRVQWTAVTGASTYRVYGRVSGSEVLLAEAATTSYDDTGTAAIGGAPPGTGVVSQNYHLWKNTFNYLPLSIIEQKGPYYFVTTGCRVGRMTFTSRKTQDRPVFLTANVMGVHTLRYDSEVTVGLDTATIDTLEHWSAVNAQMSFDGSPWVTVQDVDITIDKQLERCDNLDGYRGMTHYSRGSTTRLEATLYFSTDAEYKRYLGQPQSTVAPYGAGVALQPAQTSLNITSPNNASGYPNELNITLFRGVFTALGNPVAGRDAIMQRVTLTPQFDSTENTDFQIQVRNGESNANIITPGTAITPVPVNSATSYTV